MRGEINVLPEEYRSKPIANRSQLILAGLIMIAIFYMVYYAFGVMSVKKALLEKDLHEAKAKIASMEEGLAKYDMKIELDKVLSINKALATSLEKDIKPLSPVLVEIDKVIPEGVSLISSQSDKDDAEDNPANSKVIIKGFATSWDKLALFIDRLNQSLNFEVISVVKIEELNPLINTWNFEITGTWTKDGGKGND